MKITIVLALLALGLGAGQARAQAVVNRMVCKQVGPLIGGVAVNAGQLVDAWGKIKELKGLVDAFPEGSKEREAMTRFLDELGTTMTALEALRKASRDTAYTMDVCDKG